MVYFFMIITCETCGIKFNNETRLKCAICHPKRKNTPSRKRRSKKHWELVKLHHQKVEVHSEEFTRLRPKPYDYYAKGKRK